jgi:DNA-binding transcriptional regulator YdaS (Cro superfamily)
MRTIRFRKYDPTDPRVVACQKAIRLSGGLTKLAKQLGGITPQAVYYWQIVPAGRALMVSLISGVSVHELRPDVFGSEPVRMRRTG